MEADGVTEDERARLTELVDAGLSVPEIAEVIGRSVLSVRQRLRRYGLRSCGAGPQQPTVPAAVTTDGQRRCATHGQTAFARRSDGYYRCRRCAADAVSRRRRKVKEILVEEAGGACVLCGYERCRRALEFHHVDPQQKRLGFAMHGITLGIAALRAEAAKCVLLCANCHAEVEAGIAVLQPLSPDPLDGPLK